MDWTEMSQVMMGTRLGRARQETLRKLLEDGLPSPRFRQLVRGEVERREALES
jgi:hypothetical protein